MAVIVLAAFRGSGGLKAGTPFVIASVPLRATEPKAKARTMRSTDRASKPPAGGVTAGVGNVADGSPATTRARPIPMSARAPTTYR